MSLAATLTGLPGGAPVVVSPGLGGSAAFWGPQMAALEARHRVLAFDHRGTGANRAPLPEGYTIEAMAADVLEAMDAAAIPRAHFLGHALGGLVGLALALRAPERLASLVVVNAWASADSHTRRCFAARLALLRHVGPEAYVKAQPIFLYPAAWLSAHAERLAAEDAHALATFQGAETLEKRVGALLGFDVRAQLGRIAVPTLVAAARDDVLVPFTASEVLAAGLPHAALWLVGEGGHAFTAVDPEPFNAAVLAFFDAHPPRA